MHVQDYLKKNGLEKLKEELFIGVTDYDDRVVLNYNQIDSPRFHPICDECRSLILRKGTWEVMSRSFDRFYNVGEGEDWKDFPIDTCRIDEKLDGSIITVYHDGECWYPSTRKMAYAEGSTMLDISFAELFYQAAPRKLLDFLKSSGKQMCFIFELTSPVNRIVTPYVDTEVTLIGCRNRLNGYECNKKILDYVAEDMGVKRPKSYECNSFEEIVEMANSLETMEEGFVLVHEQDGSFRRLKCKNQKYLAIAHLRDNGSISPRRIMTLVKSNEHHEYLGYFPEDTKYFDFAEGILYESTMNIQNIWQDAKSIEGQKEFALFIMPKCMYGYEKSILFNKRKTDRNIYDLVKEMDGKKLAKELNLKKRFAERFVELKDLDKE